MRTVKRRAVKGVVMAFTLCAIAAIATPLQAATYYVSAQWGDDSRSASQAQTLSTAWKSIPKAVAAVAAGDTVYVYPGTYNGEVLIQYKSGGPNYIRFIGQGNEKPKVIAESWKNAAFRINNCSYIEINGFDVQAPASYGVGIGIENWSHHIRVVNNVAHDSGQGGISAGGSSTIPGHCDYLTINNNTVYNNCGAGLADGSGISLFDMDWTDGNGGYHNFIQNNTIYNNREYWVGTGYAGNTQHTDGNGIIVDTSSRYNGTDSSAGNQWTPWTYISGNKIYNNGGRGIHVFKCDSVLAEYNTITNNLQDPSPLIQPGGELTAGLAHDVIYRNNTVINTNGRWTNFWWSYNIQQYSNTFRYS